MSERVKRWLNPYIQKLSDFPERIILGLDVEKDKIELNRAVSRFSHAYFEFGSGSGNHLIARAIQEPQAAFVGFELRFKRAYRTIEKSQSKNVENTFVVKSDARKFLDFSLSIPLQGIYVNFPDPWARKREHKHRMLTEHLLDDASRVLEKGGFVSVKTDHESYFNDFIESAKRSKGWTLITYTKDLHNSDYLEGNVVTEFESLFLKQGLPICHAKFIKD